MIYQFKRYTFKGLLLFLQKNKKVNISINPLPKKITIDPHFKFKINFITSFRRNDKMKGKTSSIMEN